MSDREAAEARMVALGFGGIDAALQRIGELEATRIDAISTADLIAELRARGGFALAPDAPEVVALRERLEFHYCGHKEALAVCRAAGVIG